MGSTDLKEKQEEIETIERQQVAETISEEGAKAVETFKEAQEALTKEMGYKEFKSGRLRLFIPFLNQKHKAYEVADFANMPPNKVVEKFIACDQPELLFKLMDSEEKNYDVLEIDLVHENPEESQIIINFFDREDNQTKPYHLLFDGKSIKVKEEFWVEPKELPEPEEEEEIPAPAPKAPAKTSPASGKPATKTEPNPEPSTSVPAATNDPAQSELQAQEDNGGVKPSESASDPKSVDAGSEGNVAEPDSSREGQTSGTEPEQK